MKINLRPATRPVVTYRDVVRAMREQRFLAVDYTRVNGSQTTRIVEPFAITRNAQGDRYVRVMDRKSGEARTLRLDRINAYAVGPLAFDFKLIGPEGVYLSPEDKAAYRQWADEQQRAFVDHALAHPELLGAK